MKQFQVHKVSSHRRFLEFKSINTLERKSTSQRNDVLCIVKSQRHGDLDDQLFTVDMKQLPLFYDEYLGCARTGTMLITKFQDICPTSFIIKKIS